MGLQLSKIKDKLVVYNNQQTSFRRDSSSSKTVPSPGQPIGFEEDFNVPVVYGKAFLLKWESPPSTSFQRFFASSKTKNISDAEENFWSAHPLTSELSLSVVSPTSLFTFHAERANPVNFSRQTTAWISVKNRATITIYANVGNGRYMDSETFSFKTSPQQLRDNPNDRKCEFILHLFSSQAAAEEEEEEVRFGSAVYLECAAQPGLFLSFASASSPKRKNYHRPSGFYLSRVKSKFVLHNPTLLELVQLQHNRPAIWSSSAHLISSDFEREEDRVAVIQEAELLENLARALPTELIRKIFEYKPGFIGVARLTCKSWKLLVERERVKRIRVNGEFFSFETRAEKQKLLDFIQRCTLADTVTLRNIFSLEDEDIKKICKSNPQITSFILGGCRSLGDDSVFHICSGLSRLVALNLAYTRVTDSSLKVLSQAKYLQELNLYNCVNISAEGMNRFESSTSLIHINLRGTQVHHEQLALGYLSSRPKVEVLTGPPSSESIYG